MLVLSRESRKWNYDYIRCSNHYECIVLNCFLKKVFAIQRNESLVLPSITSSNSNVTRSQKDDCNHLHHHSKQWFSSIYASKLMPSQIEVFSIVVIGSNFNTFLSHFIKKKIGLCIASTSSSTLLTYDFRMKKKKSRWRSFDKMYAMVSS